MTNNLSLPSARAYLALQSARAFLKHSAMLTDRLANATIDNTAPLAEMELSEIVASATMLSLATELHLKALLIGMELPYQATHKLLDLFDALPAPLKFAIEARYKKDTGGLPQIVAIEMALRLDGNPCSPGEAPNVDATGIREVLGEANDAFVIWRYFYEQGMPGAFTYKGSPQKTDNKAR